MENILIASEYTYVDLVDRSIKTEKMCGDKKHFMLFSFTKKNEEWKRKNFLSRIEIQISPKNILNSSFYFICKNKEKKEFICETVKLKNLFKQRNFLVYFQEREEFILPWLKRADEEYAKIVAGGKKSLNFINSGFSFLLEDNIINLLKQKIIDIRFVPTANIKI